MTKHLDVVLEWSILILNKFIDENVLQQRFDYFYLMIMEH